MKTPIRSSCAWEERAVDFTTANDRTAALDFRNLSYLIVEDENTVDEEEIPSDNSDPMLICMARGL